MKPTCVRLFVYGTLKKDSIRSLDLVEGTTFIGQAVTIDDHYRLVDFGSYPGVYLTKHSCHRILGEIFLVPEDIVTDYIDLYEGYPSLYDKTIVDTTLGKAVMYHIKTDVSFDHTYPNRIVTDGNIAKWQTTLPETFDLTT